MRAFTEVFFALPDVLKFETRFPICPKVSFREYIEIEMQDINQSLESFALSVPCANFLLLCSYHGNGS